MAKKKTRTRKATARKSPVRRAKPKARRIAAPKKPARKRPAPKKTPRKKARKGAISSSVRYAGESPAYRKARDRLLKAEIELRRLTEAVAAERRKLPQGGELIEDYVFEEADLTGAARSVRFSELFVSGKDTLVVYNFMYGPAMEKACPSCTSILDALDGNAQAITQRVNFAVVAKSPIARIRSHARDRGWYKLRLLSSDGNHYNRDYHGETPEGSQRPMLNVFVRKGETIRHFWGSELAYTKAEKGQDPRHVDFMWPLWNLWDTTPIGRGTDWRPKLSYAG
jgi:predicted dithiol-disulfide oxidoreductase (DUF899 family)